MKRHGTILVISGPSGVGKDFVISRLLEVSSFEKLTAYTTRPRRSNEIEGKHYRFVTLQEFLELRKVHEFFDCTELHGHLYGTPIQDFNLVIEEGRMAILHLRAKSALTLKVTVGSVQTVFIMPPSIAELKRRLMLRGTPADELAIRIFNAEEECSLAIQFDQIVVNHTDRVDETVAHILEFIKNSESF